MNDNDNLTFDPPAIRVSDPISKRSLPQVCEVSPITFVVDTWKDLRGDRRWPLRFDLRPEAMTAVLGYTALIETETLHVRYAGYKFSAWWAGVQMFENLLMHCRDPGSASMLSQAIDDVSHGTPMRVVVSCGAWVEVIMLPLGFRNDETRASRIWAVIHPFGRLEDVTKDWMVACYLCEPIGETGQARFGAGGDDKLGSRGPTIKDGRSYASAPTSLASRRLSPLALRVIEGGRLNGAPAGHAHSSNASTEPVS